MEQTPKIKGRWIVLGFFAVTLATGLVFYNLLKQAPRQIAQVEQNIDAEFHRYFFEDRSEAWTILGYPLPRDSWSFKLEGEKLLVTAPPPPAHLSKDEFRLEIEKSIATALSKGPKPFLVEVHFRSE